jgi:hypothetical protein
MIWLWIRAKGEKWPAVPKIKALREVQRVRSREPLNDTSYTTAEQAMDSSEFVFCGPYEPTEGLMRLRAWCDLRLEDDAQVW